MATPASSSRFRFSSFEVDLRSGELRKQGLKVKIHDQPLRILAMLLEHPGEVVSREELRDKLWPADTFVDFDVGLNSAVKRLRDALGDSAESPRFIQTLPRRGYRLIVPVESLDADQRVTEEIAEVPASKPKIEFRTVQTGTTRQVLLSKTWVKAGIAVAIFAILVGIGSWWRARLKGGPYTIAVLPFKNLSSEPESDYFSDGLTVEIIHNLSIIDGLQVKSATSSFAFKGKPSNVLEVGKQLGASLVLEGSVLRTGERLRIDAQLVRASDDLAIWSGRFDRELKDIFVIQDEISRSIVNELRLKLGGGQRRYNTNLEAYDLYLKAETLANLHGDELPKSVELFENVIAKDPDFAPAHAGLAIAYAELSATPRSFSPAVAYAKMRPAAERALHLDPLLAEAHAAMGLVYTRDHAWQDAETAFRRSIQLNPNLSRTRLEFAAWVLFSLGRLEEALQQLNKARELDPLSLSVRDALDWVLISAGRYDDVIADCVNLPPVDAGLRSAHVQSLCARALLQKGKMNEAIAIFEKIDPDKRSPGFLGYAYGKAGRRAEAEQLARQYADWPWAVALIYGGLGDKDRAFKGLESMAAINDPRVPMYLTYPELAFLRDDPRLITLRQKLNLPPMR